MEKRKVNYDTKAYSSAIMENCIAYDLGYRGKELPHVETLACELTVRNQFEAKPFNCFISRTNDGWQIGVVGADMGDVEYCLVYVSGLQVMSFDFNEVAVDEIEMWHFVNECLIAYFFKPNT